MGNFAENLNLGNRFRPPLACFKSVSTPSIGTIALKMQWALNIPNRSTDETDQSSIYRWTDQMWTMSTTEYEKAGTQLTL